MHNPFSDLYCASLLVIIESKTLAGILSVVVLVKLKDKQNFASMPYGYTNRVTVLLMQNDGSLK